MDEEKRKSDREDKGCIYIVIGALALAALWNQISPDPKPAKTGNVVFDKCMERLAYGDEATSKHLCLQEVTGTIPDGENCHVEWDGHNNPTVCE